MFDAEFNEPITNIFYYKKLNDKLSEEVGAFLNTKTSSPKLYSNALRHQYASALYSRNFGENVARILGDVSEFFDSAASGRNDTLIDKQNNALGRYYGQKYPFISKENLLQKLFDDLFEH